MAVISERRGPVIGLGLLAWLLGLALAAAAFGPVAPPGRAAQVVGLSVVYLPLVLLLGAAIEPSEGAEVAAVDARRAAAGLADPGACWAATGRWRWPRR